MTRFVSRNFYYDRYFDKELKADYCADRLCCEDNHKQTDTISLSSLYLDIYAVIGKNMIVK